MTTVEILAAARFTAVSLLAAKTLMLGVVLHRLKPGDTLASQFPWFGGYRLQTLLGFLIASAGLTLHQTFWFLHEMSRAKGAAAIEMMLASADVVTVLAYMLVYVGVGLLFSGWLAHIVGRWWPLLAVGIVAGLFALGAVNATR